MRRSRGDLILVGVFVLVAGTVLVGALLWIAGANIFRDKDEYTVLFDRSVSGLSPGATVEFQGVSVGRVSDLTLTEDIPPRVAVVLEVRPGTPLRKDTRAALVGSLVTGIKFIQLQGGSEESPLLPPESWIQGDVASLEQFRDRAVEIVDRALNILQRLDQQVFNEGNNAKLSQFVNDLTAVTSSLRAGLEVFQEKGTTTTLADLVKQVSGVAQRLDTILSDLQGSKDQLIGGVTVTVKRVDETVIAIRDLVKTLNAQLSSTGGSIGTVLGDLNTVTQRLEETVDEIRGDPSLLLRGRTVPDREFE
ncbi:MAG TPA: MlaD family protein [Candidatus Binatia bacterium]|nr:MlaD family protein [Candidatus Binatia bacterium]